MYDIHNLSSNPDQKTHTHARTEISVLIRIGSIHIDVSCSVVAGPFVLGCSSVCMYASMHAHVMLYRENVYSNGSENE